MVNYYSIYSFVICFFALAPLLVYFFIRPVKKIPRELYEGRYLLFALISLISFAAFLVLVLLFSNDYGIVLRFLSWQVSTHTGMGLILLSWVIFFMHGYEFRYLFKKYLVPAHMSILIIVIFWLTALLSWNYWSMIPCAVFTVFFLLWSLKAYKITKPKIDENVPLRENDDL